MPLEIRELQIKVTVDQPQGSSAPQQTSAPDAQKADDKEAVINQCIDQVMELLNNRKER